MKRFFRCWGSNSNTSSNRNNPAPNDPLVHRSQFIDLPRSVHHKILLCVAINGYRDLQRARVTCKTFKDVIDDWIFFEEVDLFLMAAHDDYVPQLQFRAFRLRCLISGNPSALFMRGLWNYFVNANMQDGLEEIRLAVEKCYDVAIYTYAMIQRVMNPDVVFHSPLLCNLSRDFYTQTRRKINEARNGHAWCVEYPPAFREKVDLISAYPVYTCDCAPYTPVFVIEDFDERVKGGIGSRMCDRCFWIIQSFSFCVLILKKVFDWP